MTEIVSDGARPDTSRTIVRFPARAATWLARWLARRRMRRILHEMPDHLLKDVGVSRSDIEYLAAAVVDGLQDPTRRHRG